MVRRLIPMKGEEFIKKVLDGERDFSGINLEKGFKLNDSYGFEELRASSRAQPINIEFSKFEYLQARYLDLSYANGTKVSFRGSILDYSDFFRANFPWADFRNTSFIRSNLSEINLERANLSHANLAGANLYLANLCCATLEGANFFETELFRADLRMANLQNAKELERAILYSLDSAVRLDRIAVTEKEKEAIEEAIDRFKKTIRFLIR